MDLNGLEDLLLPEDQKDTIESFEDVVEYEMGDPTEDKNSKKNQIKIKYMVIKLWNTK